VHFVGLYCVITVFYRYVHSCDVVLLGRKQEKVRFAKRKPLPRSAANSTVRDYSTQTPSPVLFFPSDAVCICRCVTDKNCEWD